MHKSRFLKKKKLATLLVPGTLLIYFDLFHQQKFIQGIEVNMSYVRHYEVSFYPPFLVGQSGISRNSQRENTFHENVAFLFKALEDT